jgi:hypothetical protein
MNKGSKNRILENYYALDYVFFKKPISEVTICCPFFIQEYLSAKGALLSILVDMYKLIEHKPLLKEDAPLKTSDLLPIAEKTAIIAKKNAQVLINSPKGQQSIKKAVSESIKRNKDKLTIEEITDHHVLKRAFSSALDNMLINRTISESKSVSKLNEWQGQVLERAYKRMRTTLIETAISILEETSAK